MIHDAHFSVHVPVVTAVILSWMPPFGPEDGEWLIVERGVQPGSSLSHRRISDAGVIVSRAATREDAERRWYRRREQVSRQGLAATVEIVHVSEVTIETSDEPYGVTT